GDESWCRGWFGAWSRRFPVQYSGRPRSAGALSASRYKRPEQWTMGLADLGVLRVLRMPLHADGEPTVRHLDRFDDVVHGADRSDSSRGDVIRDDCLMVPAVRRLTPVRREDLRQPGFWEDRQRVAGTKPLGRRK